MNGLGHSWCLYEVCHLYCQCNYPEALKTDIRNLLRPAVKDTDHVGGGLGSQLNTAVLSPLLMWNLKAPSHFAFHRHLLSVGVSTSEADCKEEKCVQMKWAKHHLPAFDVIQEGDFNISEKRQQCHLKTWSQKTPWWFSVLSCRSINITRNLLSKTDSDISKERLPQAYTTKH